MNRPRYPSDDKRRKQRPHVKVHLSWPTHPRAAAAYANRDLRAIILGVWMVAARSHASQTDDKVTLSQSHVAEITACRRPDVALTWLRRAADVMGWSLERHGDVSVISVRNFAKKQGFTPRLRNVATPTPHPSEEPKNRRTEEPNSVPTRVGTERVEEAPSGKPPSKPLDPGAVRCSEVLIECVRQVPGGSIPARARSRWAREIEALVREVPELAESADPWPQVEAGIRFAFSDGYLGTDYSVVIRSGGSLRSKWSKLVAAAERRQARQGPTDQVREVIRDYVHRGTA